MRLTFPFPRKLDPFRTRSTPLTACPSFTCSKVCDLQVFGGARAPLNADRAERVSSQFFQTGKRGDSAAPDSGVEVLPCPTRQLLARSNQTSEAAWLDSFRKPFRCESPLSSAGRLLTATATEMAM